MTKLTTLQTKQTITQWDADPIITLPDVKSGAGNEGGGTYDQATQTLTAAGVGFELSSAAITGFPAGTMKGAVSILDNAPVIQTGFSDYVTLKPQFDSSDGATSDGAGISYGYAPTTATPQDILDAFMASIGNEPTDMPANCPWLWNSLYWEGSLVGSEGQIATLYTDSSLNHDFNTAGFTPTQTPTNIKAATAFGFGVDGVAATVIQNAINFETLGTLENQEAFSILDSTVTLNGTTANAWVCIFSLDTGGGHNVAGQTGVFDFVDETYNPMTLLVGSDADISGFTAADFTGVFGTSNLLIISTPSALPSADIIQVNLIGDSYNAFGEDIINDAIYGSNRLDTIWQLTNEVILDLLPVDSGITASTTNAQGEQPLIAEVNEIAVVAGLNHAVTMPPAVAGTSILVIHNGASQMFLYPALGDDLGSGVNTGVAVTAGTNRRYTAYDDTNWELE